MKNGKSMSDSGLPWGGNPAEKKKAYESGEPKNKSNTEPLGQRTANSHKLPHEAHKAHAGYKMPLQSKHAPMGGMKKKTK